MDTWIWGALGAVLIGLLLWLRAKQQRPAPSKSGKSGKSGRRPVKNHDALDTVLAWEPNATRILSNHERLAYALLTRALPEHMVLAQVPLSRFLRVPERYSYTEWLKRVGSLSADLLVCDRSSEVIAVVEVRSARETPRGQQRHERMARVLKAAKIKLLVWTEGDLPTPSSVRDQLVPGSAETAEAGGAAGADRRYGATPLSAMPLGEDSGPGELNEQREPPPSTWFDEFDTQPNIDPPRR